MHRPYSRLRRVWNTISILARNQVGRHRVYLGHYSRIFIAPKNARNAETKHWSGAVPILLLVIPASTTSAYSSLNVLQESKPRPQLLKALVYHSATSAWVEIDVLSPQGASSKWAALTLLHPKKMKESIELVFKRIEQDGNKKIVPTVCNRGCSKKK
jgi:hypothetical protein